MPQIVTDIATARGRLYELFAQAQQIAGFTGAGISTESGIPDFRSKDSAWKRFPPIPFKDFMSSETVRMESWRRKFAIDDIYAGAEPNVAHYALAQLVADGAMHAVITQNIDGLHEASGIPQDKIVELHGNGAYATCLTCGVRHELSTVCLLYTSDAADE